MDSIAPEPARPGPAYPAEALRPRVSVDPRRIEFADFIEDQDPPSSTPRTQSDRSRESNEDYRSNREAEPARHRREAAAERESRSKATDAREPESLDRGRAEETRPADDQRVESDSDLGATDGAHDENAAMPDDGPGTNQSSAASNHLPGHDPFAEALTGESGPAQTAAAAADPEDPDGPDVAITLTGGQKRRAGAAAAPAAPGMEPTATTGEPAGAAAAKAGEPDAAAGKPAVDLSPVSKSALTTKPAGAAGELAIPVAVLSKGKDGVTLPSGEPVSGDEGRPPQTQGVSPAADAVPPELQPRAAYPWATMGAAAEGLNRPHALTGEKLPQQNQPSGLAAAEPMLQESALARNENPAVAVAGMATPVARGANSTASAASGANTPSAPVPLARLGVEIASHAQAGRQRFDIRLDPPDLGQVHVRLDVDRDGHVTSRLVVDRAETLDLLRRDAPQLERALQDAGLKTDSQTMQFLLRDQGNGQQNARQDASGRPEPAPGTGERNAQAEDASTNYSRNLSRLGGLDIRV